MTPAANDDADVPMLLIFRLDGEAFAISVSRVHEILDPIKPTPVPNAGPFAPAVINVRGVVVPVVDIRHRLLMSAAGDTANRRMIVFQTDLNGTSQKLAFTADSVEHVVECNSDQIESLPELGVTWPKRFLKGALRNSGELIILLDTTEIFAPAPEIGETV